MNTKYVKPSFRNLGDIPNVQGICLSGSVANDVSLTNCISGSLASGGNCTVGNDVQGCVAGGTPDIDTCVTGNGVTG